MKDLDRPRDDAAAERRLRERNKKRRQRAVMTDEERQAVRAKDTERKRHSQAKDTERKRRSRAVMPEEAKQAARAKASQRRQTARGHRPFYGVDCEGAGKNSAGQQNLVLLHCEGDGFTSSLHKGIGSCDHISTVEALEWILSLPGKDAAILVTYFFNWDATQVLRDIGPKVAEDLFDPDNYGVGGTRRWTHFNDKYAVKYIPRQLLAVARRGGPLNRPLLETARYLYDVFGLFQSSFVKTAELWQLADAATLEAISDMKNLRAGFAAVTPEMIGYCRDECTMIAQLMTRFREHCYARGIRPRYWTSGAMARALLERHRVPKRPLIAEEVKAGVSSGLALRRPERPLEFETAAAYAYFGGRQEATRAGHVRGGIYRHDIHSAYPSKLLELPCPMHMRVVRSRSKTPPAEGLYLGWGHFQHPPDTIWGGLPVRGEDGGVYWPLEAWGGWWSPEIRAAQRQLGMIIKFEEIWIVESSCQCGTFSFVRDLYEERRHLGAQTEGLPLKFAMNAIPGKLAQKSGTRPWYDLALAGLVNSLTRAQLIEAIGAVGQRETIKVMTDCIYATKPLPPLLTGDGLGQFARPEKFDDLWIVKPGLHWPTENLTHAKTRGIPSSVIARAHGRFERAWRSWLKRGMHGDPPAVTVKFPVFVGLRVAACAMRDLKRAGRWETVRPTYGFGWRGKHDPEHFERHGDEVWLWPLKGSILIESRPYNAAALDADRESGRDLMDAMPDYVPTLE